MDPSFQQGGYPPQQQMQNYPAQQMQNYPPQQQMQNYPPQQQMQQDYNSRAAAAGGPRQPCNLFAVMYLTPLIDRLILSAAGLCDLIFLFSSVLLVWSLIFGFHIWFPPWILYLLVGVLLFRTLAYLCKYTVFKHRWGGRFYVGQRKVHWGGSFIKWFGLVALDNILIVLTLGIWQYTGITKKLHNRFIDQSLSFEDECDRPKHERAPFRIFSNSPGFVAYLLLKLIPLTCNIMAGPWTLAYWAKVLNHPNASFGGENVQWYPGDKSINMNFFCGRTNFLPGFIKKKLWYDAIRMMDEFFMTAEPESMGSGPVYPA